MTERSELWQSAFELIRTRGYEHRDEPFKLASGQLSHDYIDGKYAVDTGERLTVVSRAVAALAADPGSMQYSGERVWVSELAARYGVVDEHGNPHEVPSPANSL